MRALDRGFLASAWFGGEQLEFTRAPGAQTAYEFRWWTWAGTAGLAEPFPLQDVGPKTQLEYPFRKQGAPWKLVHAYFAPDPLPRV